MIRNGTLITALFLLLLPGLSYGQPDSRPPRRVLVLSENAKISLKEAQSQNVAPGSVLTVTMAQGPWLWVDRHYGWIHEDEVVPLDEAEEVLTEKIGSSPDALAFHHRGIVRTELGRHEAALADFDKALDRGLETPNLFINRGNALRGLGRNEEAIEAYTEAIKRDPQFARAYNNRALALAADGHLEASLADSDRAVELDPEYAEAFNNRGVTNRLLGRYEAARGDYDRAIRIYPRYAEAIANRGYARKQLGDLEGALQDYEKAIGIDSSFSQAYNDAAWLLATTRKESLRDPERAVEWAERAVKLSNRQNGDYLDTLAAAYASAGEFEKARQTALEAADLLEGESYVAAQERAALYTEEKPYRE